MLRLLLVSPADDELIASLIASGSRTKRRFAPRRLRVLQADTDSTLTTAVRVVARVHRGATNCGPESPVTFAPRLPEFLVLVISVAHLADGRHALGKQPTNFAGGQTDLRVLVLVRHYLGHGAGGADHFTAFAGLYFNVVDVGTRRQRADLAGIARNHRRAVTGDDRGSHSDSFRSDDVDLRSVMVLDQGDASRTVGVVLDRNNAGRDITPHSSKVDDSVTSLVATASVTDGDLAGVVSATLFTKRREKRALWLAPRDVGEIREDGIPVTRGGRL